MTILAVLMSACGQMQKIEVSREISQQQESSLRAKAESGDWAAARDLSIYWTQELGRNDAEVLKMARFWAQNDLRGLPILSDLLLASCSQKDRVEGVEAYRS